MSPERKIHFIIGSFLVIKVTQWIGTLFSSHEFNLFTPQEALRAGTFVLFCLLLLLRVNWVRLFTGVMAGVNAISLPFLYWKDLDQYTLVSTVALTGSLLSIPTCYYAWVSYTLYHF